MLGNKSSDVQVLTSVMNEGVNVLIHLKDIGELTKGCPLGPPGSLA